MPCHTPARVKGLILNSGVHEVTLVDAKYHGFQMVHTFEVEGDTIVVQHPRVEKCNFLTMLEVCSGMGIATFGFEQVGIQTVIAVEIREAFVNAFKKLHPRTQVIQGDCTCQSTVRSVLSCSERPGVLFGGFSCQPYSRGGAQKGAADPRSTSLHGVLNLGFLCRCSVIVLECVVDASTNRQVRQEIFTFAKQCGYHVAEEQLKLEHVWPSKRDRWWVILSAFALGQINIKPLPFEPPQLVVKHVMPVPKQLTSQEIEQLVLSPDEHAAFLAYQPNLQSMLLQKHGVCPTALHSWGNQVIACPCGCRPSGFSEQTLQTRGIYGVLLPAAGVTVVAGVEHASLRHLHPDELAVLTGVVPCDWPDSLRLALSGLGQQASPVHALWVGCQILLHVDRLLDGVSPIRPRKLLDQYLAQVREAGHAIGPQVEEVVEPTAPVFGNENETSQVGALWEENNSFVETCIVLHPPMFQAEQLQLSSKEATVGDLVSAEVALYPLQLLEVVDSDTNCILDHDVKIGGKTLLLRPVWDDVYAEGTSAHDIDEVEVSPTMPFEVQDLDDGHLGHLPCKGVSEHVELPKVHEPSAFDVGQELSLVPVNGVNMVGESANGPVDDPLVKLNQSQLASLQPPAVSTLHALAALASPKMTPGTRVQILESQGFAWADDEIRWHLHDLVRSSGKQDVAVLDPLLATEAAKRPCHRLLYEWLDSLDFVPSVVVTVVCHCGHWVPFVWHFSAACLTGHSWDVPGPPPKFGLLHDALALTLGSRTYTSHVTHRQFSITTGCGVCAVRFVDHVLSNKMLPSNAEEVEQLNKVGRDRFLVAIGKESVISRPWVWAFGLDPSSLLRLQDLLIQHGVPKPELEARVFAIQQAIGLQALQRALVGSAPWRSLKALANQANPQVQLVMPDELREVVQARASQKKPKKAKQTNGSNRAMPSRPVSLDPSKLTFDAGAFTNCQGQPLTQLSVAKLGPVATGVALATIDQVEQFLRVGSVVSKSALAAFVINASEASMTTSLPWAQCRVALRCCINNEPILVHGYLVQLGAETVIQSRATFVADVPDVEAACLKIAVYRDAVTQSWEEICKGPVRFILQQLEPLTVCSSSDPQCTCACWHVTSGSVRDPVLDVWRRQWLNLSFKNAVPESADVFVVNVRVVDSLLGQLLRYSGVAGIFLEPRTLDSRSPTFDYQVIWMPRATVAQLQHLKQTNPAVVGLARLGSRLGLRVAASDLATVSKVVKPEAFVLAAGPKLDFELGPVPYGLDRGMICKMCQGWNWEVKPINPLRSVPGGLGTIWLVQACSEPPASVFSLKGGEVVVTKIQQKANPETVSVTSTVASSTTIELCSLASRVEAPDVDPLIKNDPWARAIAQGTPLNNDADNGLKQIEERIEKAVLAKMPAQTAMDVDAEGSSGVNARVHALEEQVAKLTKGQQNLEGKVQESSNRVEAQFNQMQHQVAAQLEAHGNQLSDLFRGQMEQIECLLSKKARVAE